jgi:DNA-binding GntR family transcriptional regulator
MQAASNTWQLGSIVRASTTQQVLDELREAIIDGRIAQGEALREVSLSDTFGTGRSAVREAIRQLVQEGLVDYELHRGAFVRVMSLADRLDVYTAREAIESGAARRAVEASPPLDLADLKAALDDLRATDHGDDRVTEDLIAADIRFHQELVRLADSPRLTRAHETLAAETRMLLRHHPAYPRSDYVGDHERLFDSIEQRDPRSPRASARFDGVGRVWVLDTETKGTGANMVPLEKAQRRPESAPERPRRRTDAPTRLHPRGSGAASPRRPARPPRPPCRQVMCARRRPARSAASSQWTPGPGRPACIGSNEARPRPCRSA